MSANGSVFHHRAQSQGTGKHKKTKKTKEKGRRPPSSHSAANFVCFISPRRFLSGCFLSDRASSAMTTLTTTTTKKSTTCVSGKGRLVKDKCYSDVTVTVRLLDRVVCVLSGYHFYAQSNTCSILCARCMNMHRKGP